MRSLFLVTVMVPDYDMAIAWYRDAGDLLPLLPLGRRCPKGR